MPRTGTDASWHEFRQLASPQINVSRDDGEYGNPYVTTRAGPDAALTAPHGLIRLLRLSSVDLASTPGDQSTTGSSVLLMPSTPVGVSAGRVASFRVVSRSQIRYLRSSRRFMRLVRFPAAPQQKQQVRGYKSRPESSFTTSFTTIGWGLRGRQAVSRRLRVSRPWSGGHERVFVVVVAGPGDRKAPWLCRAGELDLHLIYNLPVLKSSLPLRIGESPRQFSGWTLSQRVPLPSSSPN